MKSFFSVIIIFCCFLSFKPNSENIVKYNLSLEAKGCHYQVIVNGQILDEGKSYQKVNKTFVLDKQLSAEGEQTINVTMFRISREMPLKSTQAMINVKLEKSDNDTLKLIKEVKLPTFPYDDDENQPQSIGGSIHFER